jgi:hypothetical protein
MMFGHVLEFSRPLSACIGSLLGGRGSAPGVDFWRGCITWSFLGGDVFLLSLLTHFGAVPMVRRLGSREGSVGGFLVGLAFLGD